MYCKIAEEEDTRILDGSQKSMDGILVFVSFMLVLK